ncbi:MAG: sigma-70 family RNA polymerase sigma factor [Tepidisphaeraceae bacterium]|jgi:RNA polymerase sigma-70 factor (ECF subfamily)
MNPSREQFEQLALAQLDTLYRVARRLCRTGGEAEDLVQETYVRALRAAESFQLEEFGIRPWLLRIMRNLHASRAQRQQRQPDSLDDQQVESTAAEAEVVGGSEDETRAWLLEGMDEQLVAALGQLPAEYQETLLLWAVDDMSYKEIALALDIPIGTVMSRLHRARQRLATQLRDHARRSGLIRE